jgi:hypothetical protein
MRCALTGTNTNYQFTHTGTPLVTTGNTSAGPAQNVVPPLFNTANFRLQCTATNSSFPSAEATVRVEVVPVVDEI